MIRERAVPDEMVLAMTLIGDERRVADGLTVWRDAGIGTVRLYSAGADRTEQLTTLARACKPRSTSTPLPQSSGR